MSIDHWWYSIVTFIAAYAAGLATYTLIRDLKDPDE